MKLISYSILAGMMLFIVGCAGVNSFPSRVLAGETVAIAAGWRQDFSRSNITATITPSSGSPVVLSPTDIRASINLYPDPLSSVVLSQRTGSDISKFSKTYADAISFGFTGEDKDWWQTTVFVDIPPSIPVGNAIITITSSQGDSVSAAIDVVGSGGAPETFDAQMLGSLNEDQLTSLERVDHYVVNFTGTVIPYAIQMDLSYSDLSGYVTNSKGDIKNVSWVDNGTGFRVIVSPAGQQGFQTMDDLKFYIAVTSGTKGLASLAAVPGGLLAFDRAGNPVSGLSASISLVGGAAGLK